MPDDDGNAGTEGDASTLTASEIIQKDGTLTEGWRGTLPEELRDDASLKTINSFHDLAKGFVHAKAQVGKDKVILPGEKATEEDWDIFFGQVGRPKTADDYRLEVPEEHKAHFKPETLIEARTLFHKIGLSNKQVEALWAFEQKRLVDNLAEQDTAAEGDRNASGKLLRERWGLAFEERKHIVNRMIAENTSSPEEQEQILALIGNHAVFANFMANVGNHFIEAKIVTDIASGKNSPSDARTKADELQKTEGYLNGTLKKEDPAKHARILAEITDLYEQANPEPVEAR